MKNKVKISDIAQKSGVSVSTVSLALNNKPGVSEETRARIFDIANSLEYPIKPTPTSLRGSGLTTIGMVVKSETNLPPQANPFYSKVIIGIEDGCRRKGINLLFATLPVDGDNYPLETPSMISSDMVDGLLMVGTFVDETLTSLPGRVTPPIVLVDGYSSTDRYDTVVSDNFRAAYQAVEYLIHRGHRHIGLVGGYVKSYPSVRDRRNGYLRAMKENGLGDVYIASFSHIGSLGYKETIQLLQEHPEITALFCVNDDVGCNALRAVKDLGKSVPDDISIVGFDDTYLAISVHPSLTTVHVDTVVMGHAAVSLLSLRLENPDSARMTLTIHPTLVERDSVRSL